jgi:hypothetical protein
MKKAEAARFALPRAQGRFWRTIARSRYSPVIPSGYLWFALKPTGGTMNFPPQTLKELHDRLLKLEKQNRRLKQLGAVAMIVVTLLVVMGQAPAKKTVEANEFILRDDGGNLRARLFMTEKSTTTAKALFGIDDLRPVTIPPEVALTLYDDKGQVKVMLNGGGISFLNSQGHLSGALSGGILSLQGNGDSSFAMLSPYNLNLSDGDGFSATLGLASLVTPRTGETHKTTAASLTLFGKNKNVIWKAP